MGDKQTKLVLADDDLDDCIFFNEVLEELPLATSLLTVNDGMDLMQYLSDEKENLPDAIFLDINMPRKSGVECLIEIKKDQKLKQLPIIIISTCLDQETPKLFLNNGADYFIRKPSEFHELKHLIHQAIILANSLEKKDNFFILNDLPNHL